MAKLFVILAVAAMLFPSQSSEPGYHSIEISGLRNVFSLETNFFSGSSPDDDAGFAALKKLGIKTIISVDGAKPDVKRAHEFGMRYIHLPHGYDGIPRPTQMKLAKAAEVSEGPIYVHCHHGKHRGPAAMAIICMAEKGWSPAQAENWLHAAGTATNYAGLFATARNFEQINAAQLKSLPATFPESQQTSTLVDAMVEIDNRFENLKAIRQAGFKTPPNHPDLEPANEAVLLMEHFRELQRTPDSKTKGEKFLKALRESEAEAKLFEDLLNSPQPSQDLLEKSFTSLANQCAACHKQFRDTTAQSK